MKSFVVTVTSVVALTFLSLFPLSQSGAESGSGLVWNEWTEGIFAEAAFKKKLVLLDLEAVWCHWCHVMEEKTYANPEVAKLLREHFLLIRADQDAHPDLSARYRDYGWPATILFDAKGGELRKLSGFVEPDELKGILTAVLANPKPEEPSEGATANKSAPSDGLRAELLRRHADAIDVETGGLKTNHRYLDPTSVEFALLKAREGDERNRAWVERTLDANLKLIDPVWGGVYQYSTGRDWDHPHFEKIMSTQAANISLYSLGYRVLGKPEYLEAAKNISAYVNSFLRSSEGAYYVSQDADVKKGEHSDAYFKLGDAERRAMGMPAIDSNIYARENGWAIEAMVDLYATSLDPQYLNAASTAATWVLAHRSLDGGGFSHGVKDKAGPFLGDNLAMARGFLALYGVTGERSWLRHAESAVSFMKANFVQKDEHGLFSTSPAKSGPLKPVRRLEENIAAGRLANMLFRYTGQEHYKALAESAIRYATEGSVAFESITEAGIIMLDDEIAADPPHFTVVGEKKSAVSEELWRATLSVPTSYVRREWWDRVEGPMPNPDVQYPKLPKPAAFVCANKRCSLPLFTKEELSERLRQAFKPAEKK